MDINTASKLFQDCLTYPKQDVNLKPITIDDIDEQLLNQMYLKRERKLESLNRNFGSKEKQFKLAPLRDFQYFEVDIPEMTNGRQLLNILCNLAESESVQHPYAVVFKMKNVQEFTITFYGRTTMRLNTLPISNISEKKLFAKYFDDKRVAEIQQATMGYLVDLKPFFTEDKIKALRRELPETFSRFMEEDIGERNYPEKMVFIGVLQEIMKHQFDNIPVAACFKLAIHKGKSGMINDILYPYRNSSITLASSTNEKTKHLREGVERFIKTFLPTNEDGLYDEEMINKYAEEFKKFYIGTNIILPPTIYGTPRWYNECYQNAIKYSKPDIFITMTTNPKWKEIQQALQQGESHTDRPDLCARVLKMKADSLLKDLVEHSILGEVQAHTVCGLPHIHILLIMKDGYKPLTPEAVNKIVCAEFPD